MTPRLSRPTLLKGATVISMNDSLDVLPIGDMLIEDKPPGRHPTLGWHSGTYGYT